MRKVLQAFCLFLCTALVTVQTVQASNTDAAAIFNSIGGTTTIDRGGVIHSQARSIYSLGGGMTTFEAKKVSLLAVDPPGFSAGCNGISWHFGGFAFISLDEIRQLVEAVAQASLGIAVDLAMQTLCPQCYAVMSKLRDMSNMMRNAAADSCEIAQNFGTMLKDSGIFPGAHRASKCSEKKPAAGETASFLDSWAGSACRLLSDAEKELTKQGQNLENFMKFGKAGTNGQTPTADQVAMTGNVTYKALSALGYQDGVMKDLWLSLLGMHLYPAVPGQDCRTAYKDFYGSAAATAEDASLSAAEKTALTSWLNPATPKTVASTSDNSQVTTGDIKTQEASTEAGGTTTGQPVCYAPPVLSGVKSVGWYFMCGFNVDAEMQTFANTYFKGDLAALKATSLGAMCADKKNQDDKNPLVFTCRNGGSDCLNPKMDRLKNLVNPDTVKGYTGLAWMVGDALLSGVISIRNNQKLPDATVKILTGSGYPLYRLLNMAAVYPALAQDLVHAYASAIAAQYAMDTLDKVARVGAQPAIDVTSMTGLKPQDISVVREHIMNMVRMGNQSKEQIMGRLAEKRQLVEVIMQVNKTLQAEVIGQGLTGNSNLAISIKSQTSGAKKP